MMIISIILILSFLLDGIVLSTVDMNTLCCPLFTLLSIIIIYPIFQNQKEKYYISCGILGLFYDICYSNTLFFNTILFIGVGYVIQKFFQKFSINVINSYLMGMISILFYRIFNCFFFIVLGFSKWNLSIFLKSIISSIIINSVYLIIFYFIVKKIRKILKKKKYKLLKVEKKEQ